MPDRSIVINGDTWRVRPSGRVTQLDRDEFALVFVRGSGDSREMRVTRYSPQQTRSGSGASGDSWDRSSSQA